MTDRVDIFRVWSLAIAESLDSWRVVPRTIIMAYGALIWHMTTWFLSIPTYTKITCDDAVLKTLLNASVPLDKASEIACTVVDVVGGPTTPHTVLVTTICGLAAVVIGLYHNSSKDWSRSILPWNFGKTKLEIEQAKESK